MEHYLKYSLESLHNSTETFNENLEFVIKKSEDFQNDTHVLKAEKTKDIWATFIESHSVVLAK